MDIPHKNVWHLFDEGREVGTTGTENGIIVLDEEYPLGARITLEKAGDQSWGITCGVYGAMAHTAFASTGEEAREKYETMKSEIAAFLEHVCSDAVTEDEAVGIVGKWSKEFTDRF